MTAVPPDPADVAGRLSGWSRTSPGQPSRASRGARALTPEQIVGRMQSAGDPQWERLHSAQGEGVEGTSPRQVLESLSQVSGGIYNQDLPYNRMLEEGVFTAVGWDDPNDERYLSNVEDYYNHQAGVFLDDEGFYEDRGQKYRFDPREVTGGRDVYTVAPSLDKAPAALTEVPTSTSYPPRPRTVAAGYDASRGVLTVMFRDGTMYNYFGVEPHTWGSFLSARSKGRFIRLYLDGKIRGPADVGGIQRQHRELMYRVARTTQVIQKGLTRRMTGKRKIPVSAETRARARRAYARQKTKAYARATPALPKAGGPISK